MAGELQAQLPELREVELDLRYRSGNPSLGGWTSLDLNFEERKAKVRCLGTFSWFMPALDEIILELGLQKSAESLHAELIQKLKLTLAPALFAHVRGSLEDANYSAALTAAVVFVEDALRRKVGPLGSGKSGADLVLVAFKTPGLLMPPLPYADNPKDNAFLLLRGWFGLVRNLHGHQIPTSLTADLTAAQLLGTNYVYWLVENSSQIVATP